MSILKETPSESLIHQLSKEVISEENAFWLKGFNDPVPLYDLELEKTICGFKADVFAKYLRDGVERELIIEICVTSKCSHEKRIFYSMSKYDVIEVFAPKYINFDGDDFNLIMFEIWGEITNPNNQEWINFNFF